MNYVKRIYWIFNLFFVFIDLSGGVLSTLLCFMFSSHFTKSYEFNEWKVMGYFDLVDVISQKWVLLLFFFDNLGFSSVLPF